jgi:hypothetical protein
MRVRLTSEDGRAVAVKRTAPEEATRLAAAAHPGVVEVLRTVPSGDGLELYLAHAGQPLGMLPALPVAQLAAVVASVAETVADLHGLGIVHGRIDVSHVLIGADGRPRLCGWSAGDDATPADDVHALGELLTTLVGQCAGDPIPERRLMRRDQACADEPTRRPTARRLAASLAAIVPGAGLAPPPDAVAMLPTSDDEHDEWAALRHSEASSPLRPGARAGAPGRAAVLLGIAAAGLVLVAGGARSLDHGGGTDASSTPTHVSFADPVETVATEPPASVTGPSTTTPTCAAKPDVDGDGCADPITIEGNVIAVGATRYQAGEEGDLVALGDWDCDGIATPAALRRTTGDIFLFPSWPTAVEVTVRRIDRVLGASSLVVDDLGAGCDGLATLDAAGERTVVWPVKGA